MKAQRRMPTSEHQYHDADKRRTRMNLLNRLFGVSQRQTISPTEYQARYVDAQVPHTLVDVRTPAEFQEGFIPGAIQISLQELQQKMARIPKDRPVIVYCRSGNRSAFAANLLMQAGYEEVYDLGGIVDWARAGLPVKR
uniref:Rhodanese-like domain-containing protein n=2 Tax=Litorilinea aerophila TaxID=1204385 RepID=A0A540VBZ7_9CHLR